MPDSNADLTKSKAAKVVALLRHYHKKKSREFNLSAISLFGGVLLAGFSLLNIWESSYFNPGWVKSLSLLLVVSLASGLTWFFYQKVRKGSFSTFYENFFRFSNREQVLNAVDLYLNSQQKNSRFYETALNENLKSVNLSTLKREIKEFAANSESHIFLRNSSLFLLISFLVAGWLGITKTQESIRTLHFWASYTQPNPFHFTVSPGDTTVEHGSTFQPLIQFQQQLPDEIHVAFKTGMEENYRIRPMRFTEGNGFFAEEIELTSDVSYYISMDHFSSPEYKVDVQLQPRFDQLSATVTPPSYTGLTETKTEYPFSELNIYQGSAVEFKGITNKPVDSVFVTKQQSTQLIPAADSSGMSFSAEFTPEQTDTISFRMTDKDGLFNRNPFRVLLNVREDQRPAVVIREPTGILSETSPEQLEIVYQATDDFGLTKAELHWDIQRAFVDESIPGSVTLRKPANGRPEIVQWNVNELNLRPRDEVTFRVRAWDNDEVSGWKWGESQTVVLQVPSLTDYFEELDSRERDVNSGLENLSEDFGQMEQEFQQFIERLRQNPEGGFEEQQNLEEIREKQQQMDEAVQKLNEQFQQIRSELENNESVSEETRKTYRELQQLMDELDDPGLREALEQLQQALENMSPEEMERALNEVDFNEKLYKERLQRTVELFRRLKMNSDLDKLARQYEDMAERLSEENDMAEDQLPRELETIRDEMDQISEQIDQLDRNPPKRSEETLRELKDSAAQELENIKQQVENLQQDVSGQEGGESAPRESIEEQQEQISQSLQQEAEKFRSSIQQMGGQQINVNILALQQALYQLLELSNVQENVTESASSTQNRSQGFVDLARVQKNVSDQFGLVSDTLFQISSELPGIPNQINRKKADVERTLNGSLNQMINRNQSGSTIASREALGGINDLSSMIATLIDQLMDQQGGGGGGGMSMQQMTEQLQQMSGDQQQLNQQLQEMINDIQGERLTREESERLDQLSRQQNEIRKQLQQLQRNGALNQGDRALSELQRLLDEMEDSINDMRGGMTDPIMVQRQQNILSRMLNAEQALQQRGEDEEREGTRADELPRSVPPDITLEELQQEIRTRLQDPNFTRFNEQYQRLIELYFEQLRRLEE